MSEIVEAARDTIRRAREVRINLIGGYVTAESALDDVLTILSDLAQAILSDDYADYDRRVNE